MLHIVGKNSSTQIISTMRFQFTTFTQKKEILITKNKIGWPSRNYHQPNKAYNVSCVINQSNQSVIAFSTVETEITRNFQIRTVHTRPSLLAEHS